MNIHAPVYRHLFYFIYLDLSGYIAEHNVRDTRALRSYPFTSVDFALIRLPHIWWIMLLLSPTSQAVDHQTTMNKFLEGVVSTIQDMHVGLPCSSLSLKLLSRFLLRSCLGSPHDVKRIFSKLEIRKSRVAAYQ